MSQTDREFKFESFSNFLSPKNNNAHLRNSNNLDLTSELPELNLVISPLKQTIPHNSKH
jgi:hypothetical protein